MNLITCNKDCVHQSDGYCKLETPHPVNAHKVDGCCYFMAKAPEQTLSTTPNCKKLSDSFK